jgi:exodeoxyribonuclease III
MKIVSYNVAGIRAILKKPEFENFILNDNIDILCIQETKAEEEQVKLDNKFIEKFQYRFWNSTKGITQRKGLSGVSIWCTSPPINNLEYPDWDNEGRILTLEFEDFILINVYVPNSQKFDCERYHFRINWNDNFKNYITTIKEKYSNKNIIICGDMNVAHLDIDICNPKSKKNKVAGFFDMERIDFSYLLEMIDLTDVFRILNPNKQKSTYWSNFLKAQRRQSNGWGIDYFLTSKHFINNIKECNILMDINGSDHCPIELII